MIRRIKLEDIDRVVELELSTLGTTLGREMLVELLDNSFSYIYVYEENNIIVGYISYSFDGDIAEMLNFAVDKGYQGRGIGNFLLSYTLSELDDMKAKSAILEVREGNLRASSLYFKYGFRLIHTRKNYYSNNENALVLEKRFEV